MRAARCIKRYLEIRAQIILLVETIEYIQDFVFIVHDINKIQIFRADISLSKYSIFDPIEEASPKLSSHKY